MPRHSLPAPPATAPTNAVEWIITKRDGGELPADAIRQIISELMRGRITDYQMSALLMAIFFRGMSLDETVALTDAMLRSGQRVEHRGARAPKVDKHSTGGVGDKISLCLAPLVAACGVAVPMISGRGLGHTGGTLDKLEAIPGYDTRLSVARFRAVVRRIGVSIIGQTSDLAPADRRIYALRDVTGTVPSMPLIAASILSKKLAAGLDALVMDVKVGSGAFMKDRRAALGLAKLLQTVGARLGLPVRSLLTDMSTPIGNTIGNALETREAIEVLLGKGPEDTRALTIALGVQMLRAAKLDSSDERAQQRLEAALSSGAAAERFEQMIAMHGGDARVVRDVSRLPHTRHQVALHAARAGYVAAIEPQRLGQLAVMMGAGRTRADQDVDPRVGIELCVRRGDYVERGQPLCVLHLSRPSTAESHAHVALEAFALSEERPRARPRLIGRHLAPASPIES